MNAGQQREIAIALVGMGINPKDITKELIIEISEKIDNTKKDINSIINQPNMKLFISAESAIDKFNREN